MKQKIVIEGSTLEPEIYTVKYEEKPETAEEHNAMRSVLYDEPTEEKRENKIPGIKEESHGTLNDVITETLIYLYQDKEPDWFEIMKWYYYKSTPHTEEDAEKMVREIMNR